MLVATVSPVYSDFGTLDTLLPVIQPDTKIAVSIEEREAQRA